MDPDGQLLAASNDVIAKVSGTRAIPGHTPDRHFEVLDPGDGTSLMAVANMTPDEVLTAVARADEAGAAWRESSARHRSDVLMAWYQLLIEHAEDLALLIAREMGKPLGEARAEVIYGSDFVRWYAEEAVRSGGNLREAPGGGATILTRHAPVGLAVLITPWNFPLAMATRKIAPALAAGCSVVIKPAAQTPLTTLFAVDLARRAGVARGLIEVVTTTDSSAFNTVTLTDPRVRKVSFTGSTGVGRTLLHLAADQVLKASMELGGDAPFLVFDDADLDRAIDGAVVAKLRNGGQSCIAANRFLVQDGIADAFVEGFAERLSQVVLGHSLGTGVGLGPVINTSAQSRLQDLVHDAASRGGDVVTGGELVTHSGSFVQATLIDRAPQAALIHRTEIFGPIASITRFTTEADALQAANTTEFGLAGYVFTESLDRALNVADRLETGLVGINQGVPSNAAAPFGGVKQSGLGREDSSEGLEEYQEIRYYNVARRTSN